MNTVLPAASSLVSFAFLALVFDQWLEKRRSFQLVWALGLLWYGLSAGTEAIGSGLGWSGPLYRAWYLTGALFVAAYLGAGTVYLLSRTGFGYFAAFAVFVGGLFAYLSQLRLIHEGRPAAWSQVLIVISVATVAAVAIAAATAWRRAVAAHIVMALLAAASVVVGLLVVTAPLASPGYALDPSTHVPVGSAMPGYIRIVTGPFNIFGALCLVFGAIYSAYVYMPKRRVLASRRLPPFAAQVYGAVAVGVNLMASLPGAAAMATAATVATEITMRTWLQAAGRPS
jgi:hypothetical protein